MKEVMLEIPHRLHNSIIGAKGRLIKAIMDECGGVIIRFPPEGNMSDKVIIRGPKEDVESAKKQLLDLVNEKVSALHTVIHTGTLILLLLVVVWFWFWFFFLLMVMVVMFFSQSAFYTKLCSDMHRLFSLMVKASTVRVADLGFDFR